MYPDRRFLFGLQIFMRQYILIADIYCPIYSYTFSRPMYCAVTFSDGH